ncbi:hypothetical protein MLD38_021007 [Melastoma candidum]|uniref:Uncharacterized protein n=1 Tax=Melastoma candidum TaxID=119954 RepID=A0ACB9QE78_9MYRT|nr:hypothetical protein MLD38_021007 [Melastoma candidum]
MGCRILGMGREFWSMKNDAWRGVTLHIALTGKLVLVCDYVMFSMEETYKLDKFNTLVKIKDFCERYQPLSTRLSPSVKVEDLVSVRLDVEETGEGKLYDSIGKAVGLLEHDLESCFGYF